MIMYVIYVNPRDFPGKVVVRRWGIEADGPAAEDEPMLVTDSIDQAREALPPGLFNVRRSPNDDPVIAEVWI